MLVPVWLWMPCFSLGRAHSSERALGMGQEIRAGCPKALSMPSSHCLYNQGIENCEPCSVKKGHTGQGCCFPVGPCSQQTGFDLPHFWAGGCWQQPVGSPALQLSNVSFPMLREPRALLEFAGQEQASLGPRYPRMEQIQLCTKTTGPSIRSHCLGFNFVALPPPLAPVCQSLHPLCCCYLLLGWLQLGSGLCLPPPHFCVIYSLAGANLTPVKQKGPLCGVLIRALFLFSWFLKPVKLLGKWQAGLHQSPP